MEQGLRNSNIMYARVADQMYIRKYTGVVFSHAKVHVVDVVAVAK